MGFLGGIGRAIGKVTKPLFGNSVLDELGTVGGFMLGGPQGAAIGRGLGKGLATGNVGQGLRGAAEGYALGSGAGALGLRGGGGIPGLNLPSFGGLGRALTGGGGGGAVPNGMGTFTDGGGGGILGTLGQGMNWATANPQRTQLLLGGLGAGLNAFGASQERGDAQGAYRDERGDVEYERRRREQYDPFRMEILSRLAGGG